MAPMGGNYEKSTIETSEQELEYRMNFSDSTDEDQKEAPMCTICFCDLSPNTIKKDGVYAHQLLGVLLCKKCYNRHNKIDYSYNELCLWCGSTGVFKVCTGCLSYFCKKCLEKNLPEDVCNNIFKNESWICFICSPKPIWEHRAICARILHSLVYTKESAHGSRKRCARNITEHASCSKRKRSNSWGGKGSQDDKEVNAIILRDFKRLKTGIEEIKLPGEEDCKRIKEELLCKADQFSLLADNIKERLQGFRHKIVSQNCNERVVKKALVFQNELMGTTIKTLNLWKADLQKINDNWYKQFKISLIPTIISEIEQPENQSDHNTVEANDHQEEPHNTNKNKFNLKLKTTSNTQFTDDEVKDSEEESVINEETCNVKEPSKEKTDESKVEIPDDLQPTQLIEHSTTPDNNGIIPNPEAVAKNEDSDQDSIFSQMTEIINSNDEPETEVNIENLTQPENNEPILCEMSGHFISESSIEVDDADSEKSFVFDIADWVSDVSSVNEMPRSDSTINYEPENNYATVIKINDDTIKTPENNTDPPKDADLTSADVDSRDSVTPNGLETQLEPAVVDNIVTNADINIEEDATDASNNKANFHKDDRKDAEPSKNNEVEETNNILPNNLVSAEDKEDESDKNSQENNTVNVKESKLEEENDTPDNSKNSSILALADSLNKGKEMVELNNDSVNDEQIHEQEETMAMIDEDKDDVFTETSEDNPLSPGSPVNKGMANFVDYEDSKTKVEFLESLELSIKNDLKDITMDIDEDKLNVESFKCANDETNDDDKENTDSSDSEDVTNALKQLEDDDDYLCLLDMEVSSSSSNTESEVDSEIENMDETENTKKINNTEIGVIINELPVLPEERDSDDENNDMDELVISGTDVESSELEDDSSKYSIKPCTVVLERIENIHETIKESSNMSLEDKELREIERLTNLDNLENKRKVQESSSKKKRKRRKIIKPSGSADSKSESYESEDSDCDIIIPSSLPVFEDINNPCMTPPPLVINSEDMVDHLINGISSDEDGDASDEGSDNDNTDKVYKKKKRRTNSTDSNKENQAANQETDMKDLKETTAEELELAEKKKWRNDPLLHGKLSDTENESESDGTVEGDNILSEKTKRKMEKLEKKILNREMANKKEKPISPKKPKLESNSEVSASFPDNALNIEEDDNNCPITIQSDTDSDIEFISVTKKRTPVKKTKSKGSDCIVIKDEDDGDNTVINSDSDSDSGNKKKGRRNIRAILSDETLEKATKKANLIEKQRKERLTQKQKHMSSFLSQSSYLSQEEGLVLDVDGETTKSLVVVHPRLTRRLKEHQKKGVQFMWDCCYESVKRLQLQDNGSGCILAHCMGLGKSFQIVTLIHTLFAHSTTNTKHVLIVCPLSLVLNWKNEFKKGLENVNDGVEINVFCISERCSAPKQKLFVVDKWRTNNGVLIMGYEAYQRMIDFKEEKLTQKQRNIKRTLVNPGPDLVVLDEGHLLKNGKNSRTKALMGVKTKRRIILTGTPLQNNLKEYYYMVHFVKPDLLGSFLEYTNRFVNPITNGQYDDSTDSDIIQMKKRSHVLHKLLRATIQRYEVSELRSYLPEKFDYVVFVRLDPVQASLYEEYINMSNIGEGIFKGKLFSHYHKLQEIWTHPYLLHLRDKKNAHRKKNSKENTVLNGNDIVEVDPLENESNDSSDLHRWWQPLCPEDYKTNINYGPKFKIMLSIIKECEKFGDKVLIFSNSLIELDAIEFFLQQHETPTSQWKPKQDFYRMDGNLAPEVRLQLCNSFNDKNNKRARVFIVSHRVGGLGLNLVAANRVILMDVSWNPAYDSQSVFRTYRFGQEKQCYVYRLVSLGTMEEVVYERQVTKLAIAGRVVDEMQITRHYKSNDLQKMYRLNFKMDQEKPLLPVPSDIVLASVLQICTEIFKYHEHQSLLENLPEEELNEDEMKNAWEEFNIENENRNDQLEQKKKVGPRPGPSGINSFLPNHFNKNMIPEDGEEPLQNFTQLVQNQFLQNFKPVPVNKTVVNRFIPNKIKTVTNKNQEVERPEGKFETVFVSENNRNAFNAEDTTTFRTNKQTELQKKFHTWLRKNIGLPKPPVTSTVTNPQNVTSESTAKLSETTDVTGISSNHSSIPTIQKVITCIPGSSIQQTNIATVPKLTNIVNISTQQKRSVIQKTATSGTSSYKDNIVIPKIQHVVGGVQDAAYLNQTNHVTLTKVINEFPATKSSVVINPVNSRNSVVLSKKKESKGSNKVGKNNKCDNTINRSNTPNIPQANEINVPKRSISVEQQELLKSLNENLNITLSAIERPYMTNNNSRAPNNSVSRMGTNHNVSSHTNRDVIEID